MIKTLLLTIKKNEAMNTTKIKLRKNLLPWLKEQLSRPGWFKNFFITRNAWAAFSINSHIRHSNGEPKMTYPSKEAALKAAEKMGNKHGVHFSVYKCLYCDGWHCGKNRENKIKSDALDSTSVTPLSIHYEPMIPITFGWARTIKSMSEMLVDMDVDGEDKERNASVITDTLLSLFMSSKEFRDILLSEVEVPIERKSLQMTNLPQKVADLYYNQLSAFRREAEKLINAKPKAFMSFFAESEKKDSKMDEVVRRITGGHASKMVKSLSVFNINAKHLANYILSWYEAGKLNVTPATGVSNLITPATFVGFCGEECIGEAFSLCSKTFEDGYVVIKCDNWQYGCKVDEIIDEWSSGVKVETVKDDTIILSLDKSKIKKSLVFGSKTFSTSQKGEFIIAIKEAGEFLVEIFYRKTLDAPEDKDIRLFAYDFCCK